MSKTQWFVGGLFAWYIVCTTGYLFYLEGKENARKDVCELAKGYLIEGQYCIPKTSIMNLRVEE